MPYFMLFTHMLFIVFIVVAKAPQIPPRQSEQRRQDTHTDLETYLEGLM